MNRKRWAHERNRAHRGDWRWASARAGLQPRIGLAELMSKGVTDERRRRTVPPASLHHGRAAGDAGKIGMWLFLVTEILLFGGLFVGFAIMQGQAPGGIPSGASITSNRTLGFAQHRGAAVSSYTMVMAVWSAHGTSTEAPDRVLAADHRLRRRLPGH